MSSCKYLFDVTYSSKKKISLYVNQVALILQWRLPNRLPYATKAYELQLKHNLNEKKYIYFAVKKSIDFVVMYRVK